ncbi:hypothetical protein [Halopseudomonas bauzanensis]|uniref:Response regulator n=1 Tax=Halopseudomonas bauzanensis TaxID=653930 RepID=A0A4U0YK39_9GAMM|nr:hypothetical protein [Halopseudomonas bauzanensis]TKA91598.1 hypothetical protein FA869_10915 [Halopseudomonas bauzanensis]
MKPASFILDRQLYEVLQEEGYSQFTTRDLRDTYAKRLEGMDFQLGDVRRFVYEQIRRMIRTGWLVPDQVQRKRGQIYHLRPFPENLKLELVDGAFERSLKNTVKTDNTSPDDEGLLPQSSRLDAEQHLQSLMKEVRLDFLSAMGEAERYKQLVADLPHLRDKVEADYLEARDRSSRLLGHLRAVEKTLNVLVAPQ